MLLIIVTYGDNAYLVEEKGEKRTYIARLYEIDKISHGLGVSKEETIKIVLDLIRQRLDNTKKESVKELMQRILSDPQPYFNQ